MSEVQVVMICSIGGQNVPCDAISYRGLGFGENVLRQTLPYLLQYEGN